MVCSCKKELPAVVFFVACPDYTGKAPIWYISKLTSKISGPATPGWEGIDPFWVPTTPVTANWESGGVPCSRTQFPLVLAWAITIHRCLGLTLLKAVITSELGATDFAPELNTYGMELSEFVFED